MARRVSFCSEASYVGTVKETTKTKIGNLHDLNDIDNYWFFAEDASDFCFPGLSDDGEIKVDFQSAPEGIEFCVSYVDHQDSGDGCGLGNESCGHRSWEFDDTSCGGSDDPPDPPTGRLICRSGNPLRIRCRSHAWRRFSEMPWGH